MAKEPYKARFHTQCAKTPGCQIQPGHYISWPRKKQDGEKPRAYHIDCLHPMDIPPGYYKEEAPEVPKDEMNQLCANCGYRRGSHTKAKCPPEHVKDFIGNGQYRPEGYKPEPGLPNPFAPAPMVVNCIKCGADTQNSPPICNKCRKDQPEAVPFEDEQFKMEVPETPYTPNPDKPAELPPVNGNDGLLALIANQVQAKVIDNVRQQVDKGIEAINRQVQDKLDKISVPVIEVKRHELPDIKIQNVHKQFKDVLQLLSSKEYVYLHGSPGGHKTTLGPQLAEALGVRFGGMSLCEQTPEYVVKGFTSPIDGKFYDSQFIDFWENGGLYQWSEMDNANSNLRTSLNTALDNDLFFTDRGRIKRHEQFYMIADGNTCGRGAHPAFPDRTAFDAAFAARFIFVEFEYDWSLCKHIATGLNKQSAPIVAWAEKVSNWSLANGVQLVMSPREVYKLAKLLKTTDLSNDMLLNGVLRGLDIPSKEKLLSNYPFPNITRG